MAIGGFLPRGASALALLLCAATGPLLFAQGTPLITSMASAPIGGNVPTLPPAITTGAETSGFTLYINGAFSPARFSAVSWADPRYTPTLFGPANGVQVSSNQIVLTIPASLFNTVVSSPIPVTVTVIETPPSGPGTITSNPSTYTLNPPLDYANGSSGLPPGVVGTPYSQPFFSGGTATFTVSLQSGTLPPGLSLPTSPTSSKLLTGTPTADGIYSFGITITDIWGNETFLSEIMQVVRVPIISPPLTPSSAIAGSQDLTLTVIGSNFLPPPETEAIIFPQSVVQWTTGTNTVSLVTTYVSSTQLTAVVPASLLATPGAATVTVIQDGTSAVSNGVQFLVNGPAITTINPSNRTAGSGAFTLSVSGTNFISNQLGSSQISFGGVLLPTTYSTGTLTATVNTPATAGPVAVRVVNPGGAASNTVTFTVTGGPILYTISPASAIAGSPSFNLQAVGANFTPGIAVYWNGSPLATTFNSSTVLTALVPASLVANAGNALVSVGTSDGAVSTHLPFSILAAPTLQLTTTTPLPPATTGVPYSAAFSATGGRGNYEFSVTAGTLPGTLVMNSNGTLVGVPSPLGVYAFTVQVTDTAGATDSRRYTLEVRPPALTITTASALTGAVGTPLNVGFAATGGTPPYSFSASGGLPPNAQFTTAGVLTATLTAPATYTFTVTVTDSAKVTASKSFTLTVTGAVLSITTTSPLTNALAGASYSQQFGATGGTAPYTWAASGLPAGLSFSTGGALTGTPTSAGASSFSVTVTDAAGTKATGTFALTVLLSITTTSLPDGTVGTAYSASLSAVGGVGALTWSITGLPAGLTGSASGSISGTPTAAGASTVAVTVTDAQGNSAKASLGLTVVAARLVITTTSVPAGTVGTGYSASFAAIGGTAPYTWSASGLPAGLNFSAAGVLSGTPTAAGTTSIAVTVKDTAGATASQSYSVVIALPTTPPLTFTGIGTSSNPGSQSTINVGLGTAFPVNITVTLTLTFAADTGGDDPAVQFATGGRTATITIPAGSLSGATGVGFQAGTVAGTVTITAQLAAGTQNVTPTPTPSRTVRVTPLAPVITSITAVRNSTGFTVTIVGYSSTRQLSQAAFVFTPAAGSNLQTGNVTVPVDSLFSTWYQGTGSAQFGSQFTYTQPFTVTGSTTSITAVSVTLTNSVGASAPASANLQ